MARIAFFSYIFAKSPLIYLRVKLKMFTCMEKQLPGYRYPYIHLYLLKDLYEHRMKIQILNYFGGPRPFLPKHSLESGKCMPEVFSTMKGEVSLLIFRLIFLTFVGLVRFVRFCLPGVCAWVLILCQRQQ